MLAGRRLLITAAASGIGRRTAELAAKAGEVPLLLDQAEAVVSIAAGLGGRGVVNEAILVAGPAERIRARVPELRDLMLGISHRLSAAMGSTPANPAETAAAASLGRSRRPPSPRVQ